MANRFDTPYGQRYVSTYVPLPLEQLTAMANQQEKKTADLLGDAEAARKLTYIKADPKNELPAQALQATYNNKLTELSNKILKEGYTPENQMAVNNTINSIVNDPKRRTIETANANYEVYAKERAALEKDGKWDGTTYDTYWKGYDPTTANADIITPYIHKGLKPKMDWGSRMQEMGKGIKADESLRKEYETDNSGNFVVKNGMVYRKGKGWEGISESKLWKVASNLVDPFFGTLEGKYYIDSKAGRDYKNYNDLSTEPEDRFSYEKEVIKKDKKGNKYKTIEKVNRSEKDAFREQAIKDLFKANSGQLFSNSTYEEDLHNLSSEAYKDLKEKENAEFRSVYENPTSTDDVKNTYSTGLSKLGISSAGLVNADGTYKNDMYESGYTKPVVDKATGKRYLAYTDVPALKDHYMELYNTANRLGFNIPKLKGQGKNGSDIIDFKTLERQLADYGQNLETKGTTSQGFQHRFSNNISNHALGEVTLDKNGEENIKISPILEAAKVTDMSNGAPKDDKVSLVKTGRLTGINFHADKPGTLRLDSDNKAYNIYIGDKTLANMTTNTWALTKATEEASIGNRNENTKIEVYELGKHKETTIGEYANNKINSIKAYYAQNNANELLNRFNLQLTTLGNSKPIDVRQVSDVTYVDENGNRRPRYEHITYQSIDPNTSVPVYNIVQIDYKNGGTPSIIDLNTVHKETTDYVESKMAHNYEPTK